MRNSLAVAVNRSCAARNGAARYARWTRLRGRPCSPPRGVQHEDEPAIARAAPRRRLAVPWRPTAATRALVAPANHELAGHRHITTTMRYMHLAKGQKEQAVRLLDQARLRATATRPSGSRRSTTRCSPRAPSTASRTQRTTSSSRASRTARGSSRASTRRVHRPSGPWRRSPPTRARNGNARGVDVSGAVCDHGNRSLASHPGRGRATAPRRRRPRSASVFRS
jgi:hypothetical protein